MMPIRHTRLRRLTAQDRSILRLLAFGNTNRQIAMKLNISQNTVKTYLARIVSRGSMTRTSLVALALHIGLVRLDELLVMVNTRRTVENAWLFESVQPIVTGIRE